MKFYNLQACLFVAHNFNSENRFVFKAEKSEEKIISEMKPEEQNGIKEFADKALIWERAKKDYLFAQSAGDNVDENELQKCAKAEEDAEQAMRLFAKENSETYALTKDLKIVSTATAKDALEIIAKAEEPTPVTEMLTLANKPVEPMSKAEELLLTAGQFKAISSNKEFAEYFNLDALKKMVVSDDVYAKTIAEITPLIEKGNKIIAKNGPKILAKAQQIIRILEQDESDVPESLDGTNRNLVTKLTREINDLSLEPNKIKQEVANKVSKVLPNAEAGSLKDSFKRFNENTLTPIFERIKSGKASSEEIEEMSRMVNGVKFIGDQYREELFYKLIPSSLKKMASGLLSGEKKIEDALSMIEALSRNNQLTEEDVIKMLEESGLKKALVKNAEKIPEFVNIDKKKKTNTEIIEGVLGAIFRGGECVKKVHGIRSTKLSSDFEHLDSGVGKIQYLTEKIKKATKKLSEKKAGLGFKKPLAALLALLGGFVASSVGATENPDGLDDSSADFDAATGMSDVLKDFYAQTEVKSLTDYLGTTKALSADERSQMFNNILAATTHAGIAKPENRGLVADLLQKPQVEKTQKNRFAKFQFSQNGPNVELKSDPADKKRLFEFSASTVGFVNDLDSGLAVKLAASYAQLFALTEDGYKMGTRLSALTMVGGDTTRLNATLSALVGNGNEFIFTYQYLLKELTEKFPISGEMSANMPEHSIALEYVRYLDKVVKEIGFTISAHSFSGETENAGTHIENTSEIWKESQIKRGWGDYTKVEGLANIVFGKDFEARDTFLKAVKFELSIGFQSTTFDAFLDQLGETVTSGVIAPKGTIRLGDPGYDLSLGYKKSEVEEKWTAGIKTSPNFELIGGYNPDNNNEWTAEFKVTIPFGGPEKSKEKWSIGGMFKKLFRGNTEPMFKDRESKRVYTNAGEIRHAYESDSLAANPRSSEQLIRITEIDKIGLPPEASVNAQGHLVIDLVADLIGNGNTIITPAAAIAAHSIVGGNLVINPNLLPHVTQTISATYDKVGGGTATITYDVIAGSVIIVGSSVSISETAAETAPVMGNAPDQTVVANTAMTNIDLSTYVTLTNGDAILSYQLASGTLPTGVTLAGGVISGTPTQTGTFVVTVTATDNDGVSNADTITLTVNAAPPPEVPPVMGDAPNQTVTVGNAMTNIDLSTYVTLTNGDAILSYQLASGTLPTGVTLAGGVISGTPTQTGTFVVTVTATDNDGVSNADTITLTVNAAEVPPVMGDAPNRTVTVGNAMTNIDLSTYVTLTNGDAILSYQLASGTLPTGVTLAGGVISGTPTQTGTFVVTVTATDNDGVSNADTITLTVEALLVVGAPTLDLITSRDTGASSSDNYTSRTELVIEFNALTNADGYEISYDGASWIDLGVLRSDESATLTEGVKNIRARGYNADGVRGSIGSIDVTIDTTAHSNITSNVSNLVQNVATSVNLTGAGGNVYEVKNISITKGSGTFTVSAAPDGSSNIVSFSATATAFLVTGPLEQFAAEVTFVDQAGNEKTQEIVFDKQ